MADAEARQELRRLLDSAVGALLMEGRSWDEVVAEVRRRLIGGEVEASPEAVPRYPVPERYPSSGIYLDGAGTVLRLPERSHVPQIYVTPEGPGTVFVDDGVQARVGVERVDEPGEPPVGSVVTDTRMRVCWRDEAGWHRSDGQQGSDERVLRWRDVVESVGGPEQQPMPGQPTIVSQPPQRAQGPMVTRPAGSLELPVQSAVLGDDGQPLLGPNGQPMLRTETETITISEVVPAGGRP